MKNLQVAYILRWFPKPSETFVFREVVDLLKMGLPLRVFTLFGALKKDLSHEMQSVSGSIERLGISYVPKALGDILFWLRKEPKTLAYIFRSLLFKPWYGFEKTGENYWAFICALGLARRFRRDKIGHIHAPWACGPATAAWMASRLTKIPFSFTARAWDIFPPDGLITEKIRDALFIRSETNYNIAHLARLAPGNATKMQVSRNGVPLKVEIQAPVHMTPPYKLLAVGRLVGKKGYAYLLEACKILKDDGLDFHLTLAGDGHLRKKLAKLAAGLDVDGKVTFTGFVTHNRIASLFEASDIFVMPSVVYKSGDRDGIPTVIMEALSHRLPVVATDVSGISEIIENEVTGLLIPEKNPAAIAAAVRKLLQDRNFAIKMAERGRSKVLQQFEPTKNHNKVLALYIQALTRPSRNFKFQISN